MLLQKQAWVTDPFQDQGGPTDFSVTHSEKLTDIVSGSRMQLIFKKLPLIVCVVGKNIHNYTYKDY